MGYLVTQLRLHYKYSGQVLEPIKIGTPRHTITIILPIIFGTRLGNLKIGTPGNILLQLHYLPKTFRIDLKALIRGHLAALFQLCYLLKLFRELRTLKIGTPRNTTSVTLPKTFEQTLGP